MEPIIKLDNVCLNIWWKEILTNISFDIFPNEIISIVGLNWTGKSALLKTIIWIYKHSSWTIDSFTNNIWYIPQKLEFDKTIPISVKEFLEIYWDKPCNDTIFEDLWINNLLHKSIWIISWWELQKVLIANALANNPDVLLMDEATSWVDVLWEESFYSLIAKIHTSYNISIVMVSHDIHTVFSKSSRILCLDKKICCIWKPEKVCKNKEFEKAFWNYLLPYIHHHNHDR